ncbi:MAG: sel1 repeat family protein [Alphaproteobacteria bacterium]|nr:sel1 repeat family protein [Alphaproteobacteria bacterium]
MNHAEKQFWETKVLAREALMLGHKYSCGCDDTPQDYRMARKWYLRAAKKKDPEAHYYLGVMYAKSQGVEKNDTKAVTWLNRAAWRGDFLAQCYLDAVYGLHPKPPKRQIQDRKTVAQND